MNDPQVGLLGQDRCIHCGHGCGLGLVSGHAAKVDF
jgi:hypothetical protein